MSQNVYKGQRYAELFSTNNQGLLNKWKVLPNVKKMYDEKLKTFVYTLKGKSPIPLMRWSKDKTMDLDHPILVFQIYLAVDASILFHFGVSCCNNLHKRITLSNNQKTERVTLLSVILPLSVKHAGTWSHLLIDLEDVVTTSWKKERFRCLDSISLSGQCSIKRIFTLRRDMIHTQEGIRYIKYDEMPRQMLLSKTDSPIYYIISCPVDSEKEDLEEPMVSQARSQSVSSSSGYFKVTRKTNDSRRYISKSVKSSGSISEQSFLNESDYNLYSEDASCGGSSIAERVDRINEIIPFLSKLSFAGASAFSTPCSSTEDVISRDSQTLGGESENNTSTTQVTSNEKLNESFHQVDS